MQRSALIAEAEETALRLVELTIAERAAYRATKISDPYARIEYVRVHDAATAMLDREEDHLLVLVLRLHQAGLATFAGLVLNSARDRCKVARDVSHNGLMNELKGKDAHATGTIPPVTPRQEAGQDDLHRVPDARRDGQARRALELFRPPAPPAQEGGL